MHNLGVLADFMTDFWKLIKETYAFEANEAYWNTLTNAAVALVDKYADSEDQRFIKAMLNAYLEHQERRYIESREA